MIIHSVKEGETVREIAQKYGISPIKLAECNGISHGGGLIPGEELLVLIPTRSTNARRKETLSDVARRFSVNESSLIAINPELCGGASIYEGQPLAVRYGVPEHGMGIGNGYFYRGTTKTQLMRALPYLSYLTISAAVGRKGGVGVLFDGREAVMLARAAGKLPILRLWLDGKEGAKEAIKGAALMASAEGYHGLCVAGLNRYEGCSEIAKSARKLLHGCGLKLILEIDAEGKSEWASEADFTVLYFDKIHKESIPCFKDAEEQVFSSYADRLDSSRAFIDLSPFAVVGEKYVTKPQAREAILRASGKIADMGCGCLRGECGRGGRRRAYTWESLENTKKKLELLSRLGYYGIAFDVARTPIYELMMWRVMFSECIGMA